MPPGLARPPSEAYSQGRCIGGAPALFPRLPRAHALGAAVPAGEWCNGNTAVFGTVILGSSPSSPATAFQTLRRNAPGSRRLRAASSPSSLLVRRVHAFSRAPIHQEGPDRIRVGRRKYVGEARHAAGPVGAAQDDV